MFTEVLFLIIDFVQNLAKFNDFFCRPGKCELYSGSSCIDHLKGKFVFVKNGENLNAVEEGVRKLFQTGISDFDDILSVAIKRV